MRFWYLTRNRWRAILGLGLHNSPLSCRPEWLRKQLDYQNMAYKTRQLISFWKIEQRSVSSILWPNLK